MSNMLSICRFFATILCLVLFFSGCMHRPEKLAQPEPLRLEPLDSFFVQPVAGDSESAETVPGSARFVQTPVSVDSVPVEQVDEEEPHPIMSGEPVDVLFESLPLPAFINAVYGNILHRSFVIDSDLQKHKDLVTLRTAEPQTPAQLDQLSRQVLESYGVSVVRQGEVLRFTSEQNQGGVAPLLFSGRSLPEVPASHRPIFQLMPLTVVKNTQVRGWLKKAFKGMQLEIMEDPQRNAILLQGAPAVVRQAMKAVKMFDQPTMRGKESIRIEPINIDAEAMAKLLVEVLNSEGYSASLKPPMGSVIVLPVPTMNIVLVFAAERSILDHIMDWAKNLDQPGQQSGNNRLFDYTVRNTSVVELGNLMNKVLAGGLLRPNKKVTAQGDKTPVPLQTAGKQLIIDEYNNSLIFQGEAAQWQEIVQLIRKKDRPGRQVLIEVTIAEITLGQQQEFGVEWLLKWGIGDVTGTASTMGGLGIGSAGLSWTLDSAGQTRAVLNAFASDNRVKILSTPRIMVKNGMEASIDVGTEVPVITSQQASGDLSTGGNTGILQTIQYRKTGILLTVRPIIYSGDQVDLDVTQEVSEVSSQKESSVQSPAILSRKVVTNLSLRDGGSVVLGGLIQTNTTNDRTGIPLLMDIPWLGSLFSVQSESERRTELIMVIVPYIIDSHDGARAVTEAMKKQMRME